MHHCAFQKTESLKKSSAYTCTQCLWPEISRIFSKRIWILVFNIFLWCWPVLYIIFASVIPSENKQDERVKYVPIDLRNAQLCLPKHWTELIIKLVTSAYSCPQFLWPETLRGQIVYRFWPSIFLLLIVDHYAIYNICKCCSCWEWTGWKCQVCIQNLCIPFKLFKICFSGQT